MICNRHHLLFFIGTTRAKKKKHKNDNYMMSCLYMRGAKIGRGGEDVVIVIVFYLSQER